MGVRITNSAWTYYTLSLPCQWVTCSHAWVYFQATTSASSRQNTVFSDCKESQSSASSQSTVLADFKDSQSSVSTTCLPASNTCLPSTAKTISCHDSVPPSNDPMPPTPSNPPSDTPPSLPVDPASSTPSVPPSLATDLAEQLTSLGLEGGTHAETGRCDSPPLRETLVDRLYSKSGRELAEEGNPALQEKQRKAQVIVVIYIAT